MKTCVEVAFKIMLFQSRRCMESNDLLTHHQLHPQERLAKRLGGSLNLKFSI
jgi:hypothetical protein